ncbi:hypothetical protein RB195_013867 [Necator americanus]|uniref:Uncharacterized protein n=1 Tax=Necator americanus TaxID=51031 RepID=A0ABR1DZ41_NECAM
MLPSDAVAGLSLLLFGIVGICLFGLVTYSMLQMIGEIVGFRFLISQAVTDILLLIQTSLVPIHRFRRDEKHGSHWGGFEPSTDRAGHFTDCATPARVFS